MKPLADRNDPIERRSEDELFKALDKGIDDMEHGRTIPHEEMMRSLRERIQSYDV